MNVSRGRLFSQHKKSRTSQRMSGFFLSTIRFVQFAWDDLAALSPFRGTLTRSSRKEVIQPQVPLRLPCYDFAPVTELAFGRSLPCGLGHGLRALPASMA